MKEERWTQAIYDGAPVQHLEVSDQGRMRRPGKEPGFGTPNIDKKYGYLRSYQVCIKDLDYAYKHRAVNLHRIIWESFNPKKKWVEGAQIDHIDRDVRNGNLENLRMVTRKQNMANRNLVPPGRKNKFGEECRTPRSSEWRYRECLRCGVRRVRDLPVKSRKQYQNMYRRELRAWKAAHCN